ncbi:hypothetical protein ACTFIZ_000136, partial [Dictyostelium cf. discoideum]
PFQ